MKNFLDEDGVKKISKDIFSKLIQSKQIQSIYNEILSIRNSLFMLNYHCDRDNNFDLILNWHSSAKNNIEIKSIPNILNYEILILLQEQNMTTRPTHTLPPGYINSIIGTNEFYFFSEEGLVTGSIKFNSKEEVTVNSKESDNITLKIIGIKKKTFL